MREVSVLYCVLCCSLLLLCKFVTASTPVAGYELEVVPAKLPEIITSKSKNIPKKIWMAVKDVKDELPSHIKQFLKRNSDWEPNVCDNSCKDTFINTTFAGTSVQWAFNLVRAPPFFASKADIWRYAVMYTYGGMYLDDDSDIKVPLDEIVKPEDRLILSEEGPSSMGDCYAPTFHLADTHTYFTYAHNVTSAKHYTGKGKDHSFFHGNTLINWAMFAAPRHPVYHRALQNVVEIVKSMYLHQSVVHLTRWDVKFKTFFCTTVFVLTYSVRELELENTLPADYLPRISSNNFREYGGNVKAISTQFDPSHYRQTLKHKAPPFLKEFAPWTLEASLAHLEGKVVMGDAGKEILLIHNGTKRHFPGYDTFLNMHFADKHVKHVSDEILKLIPQGPQIQPDENIVSVDSNQHVHKLLQRAQQRKEQLGLAKTQPLGIVG